MFPEWENTQSPNLDMIEQTAALTVCSLGLKSQHGPHYRHGDGSYLLAHCKVRAPLLNNVWWTGIGAVGVA